MSDIQRIDPARLRAQLKVDGKAMHDLAYDLMISETHLHRLLRTGAWTPQQRTNLRQALGDQAWRFVCGETGIIG